MPTFANCVASVVSLHCAEPVSPCLDRFLERLPGKYLALDHLGSRRHLVVIAFVVTIRSDFYQLLLLEMKNKTNDR